MTTLKGKSALVTAGTRGIGGAIAERLAAHGADIAVTYARDDQAAAAQVDRLKAHGVRALAIRSDASDPAAARGLVKQVADAFGRLDILVNNSGGFLIATIDDESAPEHFEKTLDWNVRTPFYLAHEASRLMGEGGRIINIGSINADISIIPGLSTYAMSKAALAGLTRGWARDLAGRAITVNTIQPGPIDTELNPAGTEFAGFIASRTALGRYGRVEEVADLAVFLASPAASYVTGAAIDVDGGMKA